MKQLRLIVISLMLTLLYSADAMASVKWGTVTCKLSNNGVATVSSDGLVTSIGRGAATFTGKANDGSGVKTTCEVSVTNIKDYSTFTAKTVEGIEMTFYVGDASKGECKVGYGVVNYSNAVDINTTGPVTIPSEVEGLKVTSINSSAFRDCKGITKITIPNTVESIGNFAFDGCTGLTSVVLGNGVKSIGGNAFQGCSSLSTITIPDTVESIGSFAFDGCTGLTSVALGNGVKGIGNSAFYGCSSLTTITGISQLEFIGSSAFDNTPWINNLPDGLLYLGKVLYKYKGTMPDNTTVNVNEGTTMICQDAFRQCKGLVGLKIPKSVNRIADGIVGYCPNLASISVADGNETYDSRGGCNAIIEIAANAIIAGCKNTTIPSTVTSIGSSAFEGGGLTAIIIPNNINRIDSYAFYNSSLETVMIGKGLRIMYDAFGSCQKLKSIAVASANPYFDSRDNCNAIIETSTNKLLVGCPTTVIPASVKVIGESAFYNYGNSDLFALTIPDNVEKIENYAVKYNYNLRSLTIGKNVKEIGKDVFYGCNALRSIRSLATSPAEIDESVFKSNYTYFPDSIYNNATLYVPVGSKINYMTSTGWSKFKKIVELSDMSEPQEGDFVEADGPLLYTVTNTQKHTCEVAGVKSNVQGVVDIPAQFKGYDVTAIGIDAFYNKKGITKVTMPASITELKDYALYSCSDLERIDLPSSLERIGYFALGGLGNVTAIEIPRSVTYIDLGILTADSLLTSVTVEEGNPVYDSRGGCNAIIETATNKIVAGCQKTVIPNEIKVIGAYAFNSQEKLSTIKIPNNVTCIDEMAFNNCGLQSITIPAKVDSIGQYAFRYCGQLTAVTSLITQPFAINENVFHTDNVDGILQFTKATLYVPIGTKALYEATEGWNKFQNIVEGEPSPEPEPATKGDVNADGSVDIGDIVMVISVMTGTETDAAIVARADVNSDGAADIGDIVSIIGIMTSQPAGARAHAAARVWQQANSDRVSMTMDGNALHLSLDNSREYTAFQFLLTLPEGTSPDDASISGLRGQGHVATVEPVGNGQYLVMGYSLGNKTFSGFSGQLLTLGLKGRQTVQAAISDVVFADAKGNTYRLTGSEATGIDGIEDGKQTMDGSVHDLQGRKVTIGNKGIYLIGNRKVVVK